jgi:membrane protein YdbS with pleckstrin-like domain
MKKYNYLLEFEEKQKKAKKNYKIANIITVSYVLIYAILFGIVATFDILGLIEDYRILGVVIVWATIVLFAWIGLGWGYFYSQAHKYRVD